MSAEISINKIIIIESLEETERLSGSELKQYLDDLGASPASGLPPVEFIQIEYADEFVRYIESVIEDAKTNHIRPLIHIELHGDKERRDRLEFANGSELLYKDLLALLIKLNVATSFNLPVFLAACYSADLKKSYVEDWDEKPAPFVFMAGFNDLISPDEIEPSTKLFYKKLADEKNFGKAALVLKNTFNGSWDCMFSDVYYKETLISFIEQLCLKETVRQRVISIKQRGSQEEPRDIKRRMLKQHRDFLEFKFFDCFFAVKQFPAHQTKFKYIKDLGNMEVAKFRETQQYWI
jgi:hypothetical protein